jgi:hypothetical protein
MVFFFRQIEYLLKTDDDLIYIRYRMIIRKYIKKERTFHPRNPKGVKGNKGEQESSG